MGSFITNYQVRADSTLAVRDAIAGLIRSRAYVSPPKNGWVTVYDEASDEQDDALLRRIASAVSKKLETSVLAFLVHDSDIAMYWLFQRGQLVDEFNSAPAYFGGEVDAATRAQLRGNPDALLPLCLSGTTREQVDVLLHPPDGAPLMAEELLVDLASVLGIDEARISLGFKYFDEEGEEVLPDVDQFEPVGRETERKAPRSAPASNIRDSAGPNSFAFAVAMLTHDFEAQVNQMMAGLPPGMVNPEEMLRKLRAQFDRNARTLLKNCSENQPSFEELKEARDAGVEALAELIARRAPEQMTQIGVGAAGSGLTKFVAALLKFGLDPKAKNSQGLSPLGVSERHPAIYQLLKQASPS